MRGASSGDISWCRLFAIQPVCRSINHSRFSASDHSASPDAPCSPLQGPIIDRLSHTAESAGGKLVALNTHRLAMRQYDQVSDSRTKKPLSQRWHRLSGASLIVPRDCYSIFPAKHATQDGHSPSRLAKGWAVAQPLPERAGLCQLHESTSGLPCGNPTVAIASESIARQRRFVQGPGRDVVRRQTVSPDTPRTHAF